MPNNQKKVKISHAGGARRTVTSFKRDGKPLSGHKGIRGQRERSLLPSGFVRPIVFSRFSRESAIARRNVIYFYDPNKKWGWLANFSDHPISIDGLDWKTVEHYFQSCKFAGTSIEIEIQRASSPYKAKALAKSYRKDKRKDWDNIRLLIMYKAVQAKFYQHRDLQKLLILTGDATIIEDTLRDSFWGQARTGRGHNVMGQILMILRDELRSNKFISSVAN